MKAKNDLTGVVHKCTGRKIGPLGLHEKLCGGETGLFWLKADNEPVTCTKCLSLEALCTTCLSLVELDKGSSK